jgi:phosphohistidine phosphatase SixA
MHETVYCHCIAYMSNIILMRHARAEEIKGKIIDLHRSLSSKHLPEIEKSIVASGLKKGLKYTVLSSHALRAISTAMVVMESLKIPNNRLKIESDLYYADTDIVEKIIKNYSTKYKNLIVIGHNPSLENLAQKWTNNKRLKLKKSQICILKVKRG